MNTINLIKAMSRLKLIKEDNSPVEIIDNIYIGSVAASLNKEKLEECKITHIIVAAKGLKKYFPELSKNFNLKLNIYLFYK